MTRTVITPNNATSALSLFTTPMQNEGYVLVDQGVAYTHPQTATPALADVYRSPGTLNSSGLDHYIVIGETVFSGTRYLWAMPCEGWDPVTHQGTKYIPHSPAAIVPAADFSIGSTPAGLASFFQTTTILFGGGATSVTYDITIDRILAFGSSIGTYVGLAHRTMSPALDPRPPLLMVTFAYSNLGVSGTYGGATREPAQTSASATNWRAQTYAGRVYNVLSMTPGTGSSDVPEAYSGLYTLSPVYVFGGRFGSSGQRAILDEVRFWNRNTLPAQGDTMNVTDPETGAAQTWTATYAGMFVRTA